MAAGNSQAGYHAQSDIKVSQPTLVPATKELGFTLSFENFFHPFVGNLIGQLNQTSLAGLMNPNYLQSLRQKALPPSFGGYSEPDSLFKIFWEYTKPDQSPLIDVEGYPKEIDVRIDGAYANYNWELFFHIPLMIAVHLSKNQRFAEAQRWFHFIFNPFSKDAAPEPERYWGFLAFRSQGSVTQIDRLLALLSQTTLTKDEQVLRQQILDGYEAIKNHPYQPHKVARTRPVAYQYSVVMKYLDNLIAWGDSLFLQDTVESINEATQLYVLAANVLGERPQRIPQAGTVRPKTFAEIKANLDAMGNAVVELEAKFPFNIAVPKAQGGDANGGGPLFGIGQTLYFCIPPNDKLLGYWDTVADRLFKIRHCMNIEGIVRQLPLFDPPIDPGMLVKAAAAGIDIGSIVNGLNQPASPVRSLFFIQKALELCGELRAFGSALLQAIEKREAEQLSLLRQSHEIKIQQLAQDVRFLQWKQAEESTASLLRSRAAMLERYRYYQQLLGVARDDSAAPDTFALDRRELTEDGFDEAYAALVGQYEKTLTAAAYPQREIKTEGTLALLAGEYDALNAHADRAFALRVAASGTEALSSLLALVPDADVVVTPMGTGTKARVFGGSKLADVGKAVTAGLNLAAQNEDWHGHFASTKASYERRADDWLLQLNVEARQLMQLGRQIIGSLIAEQIAHHEYLNVRRQIEQSQAVDEFLHDKFSNEELYAWMQGEISRLFYEHYRFTFDTARQAVKTVKLELMRPELDATDFIKFNYWDAGRKGLLSGEALYLDLKRLEMAYHENNRREYELTKHVSLRQLDPLALLALKTGGACEVTLPEWAFDLDAPGHYMRRIKNVAISIPSVTGPYTSVNCTVSLLRSSVRKLPTLDASGYNRSADGDDARFVDYFGTIQSIVTSSANNDAGLFEANLRDERFLPFEGCGACSTWRLELPKDFRQFDYDTIADVVMHIKYTARPAGAELEKAAVGSLATLIGDGDHPGLVRLFSLKHDFPSEWHLFVTGTQDFTAVVKRDYFPYFVQGRVLTIAAVDLWGNEGTQLKHGVPAGLTLPKTLKDGDSFSLAVSEDAVLTRQKDARVFIVLRYSAG